MRILLVEDHVDAREVLTSLLELEGHQVTAAADGRQGLALAPGCRPDAAVIDIGLPDMSGYDVARQLRATPTGAKIPIVAMTGFTERGDHLKALEAGFDRHLVKPVDSDDLLAVLSVLTPRAPTLASRPPAATSGRDVLRPVDGLERAGWAASARLS